MASAIRHKSGGAGLAVAGTTALQTHTRVSVELGLHRLRIHYRDAGRRVSTNEVPGRAGRELSAGLRR